MKETINFSQFTKGFQDRGRLDSFSYEGLEALFNYYEEFEEATGEVIEFDPVAICCDFSEYGDLREYKKDTGNKVKTKEELEEETTVLETTTGSLVIGNY